MNCANHVDVPAVAYCRTCGKPLCSVCRRDVRGVIYCEECLASHLSGVLPPPGTNAVPPGPEPQSNTPSPVWAAILGFIPGVGAMYNGEFAKGFVHVLIFATLIWMANNVSPLFGIGIAAFVIYMPLEAYKTAKAREMGLPAPDPLGFNTMFSSGPPPNHAAGLGSQAASGFASYAASNAAPHVTSDAASNSAPMDSVPGQVVTVAPLDEEPRSRIPVGAFILIGLGVLFLLGETDLLRIDWVWRFWPLILIAIGIRVLLQRQQRGR